MSYCGANAIQLYIHSLPIEILVIFFCHFCVYFSMPFVVHCIVIIVYGCTSYHFFVHLYNGNFQQEALMCGNNWIGTIA